jgi:hypothetical protein
MKKLLLFTAIASLAAISAPSAEAKSKHHHGHDGDHHDHYYGRTRTIYVIEHHRPVRRVVYVNPGGGYYRYIGGRRVVVRERYYTSYPSRYYYADGRPRVGISFTF